MELIPIVYGAKDCKLIVDMYCFNTKGTGRVELTCFRDFILQVFNPLYSYLMLQMTIQICYGTLEIVLKSSTL